jgi:hypothetical protein
MVLYLTLSIAGCEMVDPTNETRVSQAVASVESGRTRAVVAMRKKLTENAL